VFYETIVVQVFYFSAVMIIIPIIERERERELLKISTVIVELCISVLNSGGCYFMYFGVCY
jgi:hypothetical protein